MSRRNAQKRTSVFRKSVARLHPGVGVGIGIAVLVATLLLVHGLQSVQADNVHGFHDANGNKGGFWNKSDVAFYMKREAITDSRTFYMGDSITLPDGLELTVTKIERNWQPPAAVSNSFGRYADGDNPAGREVMLVWFTGTNHGTTPIGFTDSAFTLTRAGRPEQRVARLASLPPSAYGDQGVQPWLLPGESKTTFVPFLVNHGEVPTVFHYYEAPPVSAGSPPPTLTRLSIELVMPKDRTAQAFAFQGDTKLTVGQ